MTGVSVEQLFRLEVRVAAPGAWGRDDRHAERQGGWTALRDRLVDDLEARGQVLPQQLQVALGGLRTLRRLTPAAYTRAGRLAGLEAAFVAGAITRASRAAAMRDEDVLGLLLPLVDRTRRRPR